MNEKLQKLQEYYEKTEIKFSIVAVGNDMMTFKVGLYCIQSDDIEHGTTWMLGKYQAIIEGTDKKIKR